MKTIFEIPTKADNMTMPGGIALRAKADGKEFVVHNFNTDRATGKERHYFQGSYFHAETPGEAFTKALTEFTRRADRAAAYDLGGALDFEKMLG